MWEDGAGPGVDASWVGWGGAATAGVWGTAGAWGNASGVDNTSLLSKAKFGKLRCWFSLFEVSHNADFPLCVIPLVTLLLPILINDPLKDRLLLCI